MNIEQLKVDESLWPEGATHYIPEDRDTNGAWLNESTGESMLSSFNDSWDEDFLARTYCRSPKAIPRPTETFLNQRVALMYHDAQNKGLVNFTESMARTLVGMGYHR